MASRRRPAVAPLYYDEEENDDFDLPSQLTASQQKFASEKAADEAEMTNNDDSILEENVFAKFKHPKPSTTKVNPLKALKSSQPSSEISNLVAPAQTAASLKEKKKSRTAKAKNTTIEAPKEPKAAKPKRKVKEKVADPMENAIPASLEPKISPPKPIDAQPVVIEDEDVVIPNSYDAGDDIMIEDDVLNSPIKHQKRSPTRSSPPRISSVDHDDALLSDIREEPEPPIQPAPQNRPDYTDLISSSPLEFGGFMEDSASPSLKLCIVCKQSLEHLDVKAREYHVNKCLDGDLLPDDDEPPPVLLEPTTTETDATETGGGGGVVVVGGRSLCIVCNYDITTYNQQRRMQHLDRCTEKIPMEGDGTINGKRYACILCKKDLSSSNSSARIAHVRKCASKKRISVAEMGKIIAESKIEDRMPQLGAVHSKKRETVPGAPKSRKQEEIQLAAALSASEKDTVELNGSGNSPFVANSFVLDSQHDLAGFRMSQYHHQRSNAAEKLTTVEKLAQLPFEDEFEFGASQTQTTSEFRPPPSALASKYARQGGSPRKRILNLWSVQCVDPDEVRQEMPAQKSASSPTKTQSGSFDSGGFLMSQTGAAALDALVDLIDEEEEENVAESSQVTTARRKLEFEAQQQPDIDLVQISASNRHPKKRGRVDINTIGNVSVEETLAPPKRSKPNTSSASMAQTNGSTLVEKQLQDILRDYAKRTREIKMNLATSLLKLQAEYFGELGKIAHEKDSQINRVFAAHPEPLSLLQRMEIRGRAETTIAHEFTETSFPSEEFADLIAWANRNVSPSDPTSSSESSNSSNAVDVAVNDSSPEFKTPPPRMPAAKRISLLPDQPTPVISASSDVMNESIVETNVFSRIHEDSIIQPYDRDELRNAESFVYSSGSPPPEQDAVDQSIASSNSSFSSLTLAELKVKAKDFGIKTTLTRQQIIDQLERIRRARSEVEWSPRTAEAAEIQRAGLIASPAPPQPTARVGAILVHTRQTCGSDEELKRHMTQAIKADKELWIKILQFQSVEIDEVQDCLLRGRVKVSKEFIRDYCVEKSVVLAKAQRTKD